jgi:hypothetical protein
MLQRTKINPVDRISVPSVPPHPKPILKSCAAPFNGRLLALLLSSAAALVAAVEPSSAMAQTAGSAQAAGNTPSDDIRVDETLQDRFDRRITVPGTQIGAVSFQAQAVADLGFNDNVFAQDSGVKSDAFADYGLRLDADYHYDGLRANLSLTGQERRYFTLSNEDFWQGGTRLQLSDQLGTDVGVFLDGGVQRLAVPRTDPNTINGFKPATYLLYDAETGTTIGNGADNLVTLTTGYSQTIYDQSFGAQGLIITNDRDRQEIFGDARFDHTFFGNQKVFVEVRPDGRSFGRDIDASGFRRASNGVRSDAGFQLDVDGALLISLSGGYQTQTYADARYGTIDEPDITGEILWSPTQLTQIDLKYLHEYYEDIFVDSPGYVHDMTTVTLTHELRRDILLKLDVMYDDRQLERSTRHFDILTSEARVDYEVARGLTVGVDYTNQNLTSNASRTFDDNIVMLSFKKQF